MSAYAIEPWHDFFVAQAGAGAALAGLVFVAISINLQRLLAVRAVQGRAVEALTLLVSLLIVGLLTLIPGQGETLLGIELTAFGVMLTAMMIAAAAGAENTGGATRYQYLSRLIMGQCSTLPIVAAGISLLAGWGGGLYWLAVSAVFAIVAGMIGAWVLLVEILR